MLYLEHRPAAPLDGSIEMFWYARGYEAAHHRERVLPNGRIQVVMNLANDYTVDFRAGEAIQMPAALVVGVQSGFLVIDTADLAEMIGFQFRPGGILPYSRVPADEFRNSQVALDELWGLDTTALRHRLQAAPTPEEKFRVLEGALLRHARLSAVPHPAVEFALQRFRSAPGIARIEQVTSVLGLSRRRFTQVFREQVGVTPKLFCRIRRFRQAVESMARAREVNWNEVALSCGYFDQPHFVNDFRAFSGLNPTAYCARRAYWSTHVALDE